MLSNETKEYIAYLIQWITGHDDIELEPTLEYEMIRVIMDAAKCYEDEMVIVLKEDN